MRYHPLLRPATIASHPRSTCRAGVAQGVLALAVAGVATSAPAVTITATSDPTVLADQLLAGSEVRNIEGDGQIGTFSDLRIRGAAGTELVLSSGVMLSSGFLAGLPASNTASSYGTDTGGNGDGIINAFPIEKFGRGSLSHDAAVIRLRFDAPENVTGIIARFVYASDEFPEFSGTQYADGFAFARSEVNAQGIKESVNYAILPSGNPVSLLDQSTNIHFMANGDSADAGVPSIVDLEFDGFTRILELRAPVIAGATEDFTIVVADTGDHIYDSAVFLSGLTFFNDPNFSFSVGTVQIEDNPAFQEITTVPVPAAGWLLASGLGLLGGARRRWTQAR